MNGAFDRLNDSFTSANRSSLQAVVGSLKSPSWTTKASGKLFIWSTTRSKMGY
jgi:hypothetical protein